MANSVCGLTIIKRMTYRGLPEEWSNHYQLSGATPPDSAAWRALFDALVAQEKNIYSSNTVVVGGYGYDRTPKKGDHAIWALDLTVAPNTPVPGLMAPPTGLNQTPGDAAVWVRWGLDRFNAKGKRVYLRKYFHDAEKNSTNPDQVLAGQVAALDAFGAKMMDGSFLASRTIVSPPDKNGDHGGMVPIGHASSQYITTRSLKRRGKRPPTSAP